MRLTPSQMYTSLKKKKSIQYRGKLFIKSFRLENTTYTLFLYIDIMFRNSFYYMCHLLIDMIANESILMKKKSIITSW